MGFLNFFTQEIAIDLGTANFLIEQNEKIVVEQPSIIAVDSRTNQMIAFGHQAYLMEGKTHESIRTIRPLRGGVIADFKAAEQMIKGMLRMIPLKNRWATPSFRMAICIPSGITEVEKRAVQDSAEYSGAKELYLIHEPMAAAIGIGLDVKGATGHMIIDIGGGTTEIAVISLGGIVCDESLRVAGENFDEDIVDHMRTKHNLLIGRFTAEQIKIAVGAVGYDLKTPPPNFSVKGRNSFTGMPQQVQVGYQEIVHCLEKSISKIEEAIMRVLENIPPELSSDIYQSGIYLTGGGAMLRGLDQRIAAKTHLPVHVVDDPLRVVMKGTSIALKNSKNFSFLMK
ncbi:rod shape-determining protein [Cytophagaceae bacterium YF14B1]|uniref:Cell shape-determining protein MreB n=1 Tax=Xanthocytophaga flava TaxID=3048013 RepID=A0AAE3QP00_9BACT|nr:rod shape-determining protein [Xanthocytophaga flavus]MDJ1480838.1 rod shape-determining protein [Xanthocytophaga flavus]